MFKDWREMPAGYYADPVIKADHDRRRTEEQQFTRLVEKRLSQMGYEPHDIPSEFDIDVATDWAYEQIGDR